MVESARSSIYPHTGDTALLSSIINFTVTRAGVAFLIMLTIPASSSLSLSVPFSGLGRRCKPLSTIRGRHPQDLVLRPRFRKMYYSLPPNSYKMMSLSRLCPIRVPT